MPMKQAAPIPRPASSARSSSVARSGVARSAAAILTGLATVVAPPLARAATEEPEHAVVVEDGDFQLRDYAPTILAEVTVETERERAGNAAFNTLANYIFAKGEEARPADTISMTAPVTTTPARETIEMTAPVTQAGSGGRWTVAFVMPSKWTMDTLPEPVNEAIELREQPGRRMAVVTLAGRNTDANVMPQKTRLEAWIAERGLTPAGPAEYAFYDPPFTPPPLRRNEVMIPVAAD